MTNPTTTRTSAAAKYRLIAAAGWHPDARITASQWAERDRVLPPDTPEPGAWRNERVPYLVDIQDTMSAGSRYREGWVMKGHQVGGSSAGENFIGAAICGAAGSILVVFATLEDAKQWEAQRFEPMRRASPELRRRVHGANASGSRNTKLRKRYPGGVMRLVSANRVGGLKSATMRYIKFEEPDEYVTDLENQGNPIALASKRASNYGDRAKIYGDGTPTIKGSSAIERHYERGDRRQWLVPCPGCKHTQPFEWDRFTWDPAVPDAVKLTDAYVGMSCSACRKVFTERQWKARSYARRSGMTEAQSRAEGFAHWAPTQAGEPGVASWHLPSLMAPLGWREWWRLAAQFDAAKEAEKRGDLRPLKEFSNNELGETFEEKSAKLEATDLEDAADDRPIDVVPEDGLVLVAFVDVQDDRFEVGVWALGEGDRMWPMRHRKIPANPGLRGDWDKVYAALSEKFRHFYGGMMSIDAAAIDTGGHFTHDVYRFVRSMPSALKIAATKGTGAPGVPIVGAARSMDVNWHDGSVIKGGVKLWFVGVDTAKNTLVNRISAGKIAFSKRLGTEWFEQLAAEHRVLLRTARGERWAWIKREAGARNEALDIAVGALWCAERLGVSTWPEAYWQQLRARTLPTKKEDAPVQKPASRRNFATDWGQR